MKIKRSTLMSLALLCFFLSSTIFSTTLSSQQKAPEKPVYYVMSYMKVKPENISEYKKMEKVWKKMHQARIKNGILGGWFLEEVVSPYGTNTEYNYVTGNIYVGDKMLAQHFEGSMMGDFMKMLSPDEMKLVEKTSALRDMVKEEVFRSRGDVPSKSSKPSKITVINYMKFNKGFRGRDMGELENKYWKPLHAERVKNDKMDGWGMYSLELPYGSDNEYDAATVDNYTSMFQMLQSTEGMEAGLKKLHPNKSPEDIFAETSKVRKLIRGEVWMLEDFALPEAAPTKTATKDKKN